MLEKMPCLEEMNKFSDGEIKSGELWHFIIIYYSSYRISTSILIVVTMIIRTLPCISYQNDSPCFVGCGGFPLACTAIHSVPIQSLDRIRYAKKFICGKDLSTSMMGTTVIPNMANMPGAEQPTPVVVSVASLTSPIEIIWLVGMCVCMLFFIVAYVKHIRQFKMSLPIENNFGALWLQKTLRRCSDTAK